MATEPTVEELRSAARFSITRPIAGTFGPADVTIIDLSITGAKIEHPQALRVGTRARLAVVHGDASATVPAIVVWSHLSKSANSAGKYLYVTGIRVEAFQQELAIALNALFKQGIARKDLESLEKKRIRLLERLSARARPGLRIITMTSSVSADQVLLVQHARERLLANPEEASKWYNRARYAITHGRDSTIPEAMRNREDVLAVWEYLERSIDVTTVAAVFEKLRSDRSE